MNIRSVNVPTVLPFPTSKNLSSIRSTKTSRELHSFILNFNGNSQSGSDHHQPFQRTTVPSLNANPSSEIQRPRVWFLRWLWPLGLSFHSVGPAGRRYTISSCRRRRRLMFSEAQFEEIWPQFGSRSGILNETVEIIFHSHLLLSFPNLLFMFIFHGNY